jgi:TonB-dependent starch-binding outer membrane protein SusC
MKKLLSILALTVPVVSIAFAQEQIKGIVKDDAGLPVPGATVVIKGTSNYTVTDLNGEFNLAASKAYPFSILFNLVGYQREEIEVYEPLEEDVEVSLKLDHVLNEIIVVGYGTQKKSDLTGAVASVPEQLLQQPVSSMDRMLQGAVAGVQVTPTSGQPGGGVSIRIRGGSSITGGNEPLYVIDGFPITTSSSAAGTITGAEVNPLSTINPNDIESIDILKDASATAIYGSRGANGVVIITTKKGKVDTNTISYDASVGVQSLRKKIDLIHAQEFAALRNEALYDTNPSLGANQYLSQEQIDALGEGTDWQDEAFQQAVVQNHQISLSGGSAKTRYYVSGNYFNQDGIIRNTDFQRLTGRVNLDIDVSEKLNIGTNLTLSKSNANIAPTGIVTALLIMPPTATVYDDNGGYTLRNPFENILSNPIASLNEQVNQTGTKRLLGTTFGAYTIADGLLLKVSFGADVSDIRENRYLPTIIYEGSLVGGEAGVGFVNSASWLNENTLNYNKEIGKHNFSGVLGFTQQEDTREVLRTGVRNFVSDHFEFDNLESGGTPLRPYSRKITAGLLSYLGRINYSYDDRYLLTLGLRSDGSSRFGENNKWGYFPSAAISWKITNEKFFNNLPLVISDLKLRASFGATGNNGIDPYSSLATLNNVTYVIGGSVVNGFTPSRIANPDLGWETSYQSNAGLDVGLFKNRITLTTDVYRKKTEDLLLNVELPYTSGYSTSLQNYGSVLNRGVEIGINTVNLEGKLQWNTGLNFSLNRNEVLSLGGGITSFITGDYIVKVGEPLGTFYATQTDGILQIGEESTKGAFTGSATPKAGDRLYKDISGDGKFTTALDRTVVGNAQPDFIFGITNTLRWKGIDLSLLIQGSQGNKILNGNRQALELFNGQQNAAASALERYTTSDPSTSMPRAKLDPAPVFSNRFIEDGSFIRLKTASLGYTLSNSLAKKLALSTARIYVIAQNLLTWTDYTGFDPEVTGGNNTNSTTQQGTDSGIYPVAKTVSAGISLSF